MRTKRNVLRFSAATVLAAAALAPDARAQVRYFVEGKPHRTADAFAKAAPEDVVRRSREIETGLGRTGPAAAFHYYREPSDLLVVSTLDSPRTRDLAKLLVAAHRRVRKRLVEPGPWKRTIRFTVTPPAAPVTRPDWEREIVLESVPGSGGLSRFAPGSQFDVSITDGVVTSRDESAAREGVQVGAGADGRLRVTVDKGALATARTGIFTAVNVKDPDMGGFAEVHFSLDDPPVRNFPIVFLLSDDPKEYAAALSCLETAFPLTPERAAQVKAARDASGFVSDFPPAAVYRDFKVRLPGDDRWVTENHLIHRLAHVVPRVYYGPLPFTVAEAIAWDVELAETGAVESLCPYLGVSPDVDPDGWEKTAAERMRKEGGRVDVAAALSLHESGLAPETRDAKEARRELTGRCAVTLFLIRSALDDPARNAAFRRFLLAARAEAESRGPLSAEALAERFRAAVGD